MRYLTPFVVLAACASAERPRSARYHWDSESALSTFMKKSVNTPFSRLSFLLFHDRESDTRELVSAAGELASAAANLHAWENAPGDSGQAQQVFYEYAAAMKVDANQLVSALANGQREAGQLRFERLREKCDSCHHFFRFGQ